MGCDVGSSNGSVVEEATDITSYSLEEHGCFVTRRRGERGEIHLTTPLRLWRISPRLRVTWLQFVTPALAHIAASHFAIHHRPFTQPSSPPFPLSPPFSSSPAFTSSSPPSTRRAVAPVPVPRADHAAPWCCRRRWPAWPLPARRPVAARARSTARCRR